MTHPVVDVEQSEQYYEFIVGTLDPKGDFKVHEEAVHGFCDAGWFIPRDISCVGTVYMADTLCGSFSLLPKSNYDGNYARHYSQEREKKHCSRSQVMLVSTLRILCMITQSSVLRTIMTSSGCIFLRSYIRAPRRS